MITFIIDIGVMLNSLPLKGVAAYYVEDAKKIDIYMPKPNCVLKATYKKPKDINQVLIFKESYFKSGSIMQVIAVENNTVNFKIVKEG